MSNKVNKLWFVSLLLILGLVACGGNETNNNTPSEPAAEPGANSLNSDTSNANNTNGALNSTAGNTTEESAEPSTMFDTSSDAPLTLEEAMDAYPAESVPLTNPAYPYPEGALESAPVEDDAGYPGGLAIPSTYQESTLEAAVLDSIEVTQTETTPVEVTVTARGNLPDSCASIFDVSSVRTIENVYLIEITIERPGEACDNASPTPFIEVIPLNLINTPAGTYTIEAHGLTDSFTLEVDNTQ